MSFLVLNEIVCIIAFEHPDSHEDHEKGAMNSPGLVKGKLSAGKGTVVDAHEPIGGFKSDISWNRQTSVAQSRVTEQGTVGEV